MNPQDAACYLPISLSAMLQWEEIIYAATSVASVDLLRETDYGVY
jgi:hypothetical protein